MHGFILWLLPSLADVSCVSLFRPEITAEKTMQRKLSDDFALPWNTPIARFCKILQNRSIDEKPKEPTVIKASSQEDCSLTLMSQITCSFRRIKAPDRTRNALV